MCSPFFNDFSTRMACFRPSGLYTARFQKALNHNNGGKFGGKIHAGEQAQWA